MLADFANKLGNGDPVRFASSSIELFQVACGFGLDASDGSCQQILLSESKPYYHGIRAIQTYRHVCDLLKGDVLARRGWQLHRHDGARIQGSEGSREVRTETNNADARDWRF